MWSKSDAKTLTWYTQSLLKGIRSETQHSEQRSIRIRPEWILIGHEKKTSHTTDVVSWQQGPPTFVTHPRNYNCSSRFFGSGICLDATHHTICIIEAYYEKKTLLITEYMSHRGSLPPHTKQGNPVHHSRWRCGEIPSNKLSGIVLKGRGGVCCATLRPNPNIHLRKDMSYS